MIAHVSTNHDPGSGDAVAPSLRRRRLLARLAAERAALVWPILNLPEEALTTSPVFEDSDWSVKDLLAHVAAWDRWQHEAMAALLGGRQPDFSAAADWDVFNAAAVDTWRHRSLGQVLTEMRAARTRWVAWIREVPLDEFFAPREVEGWDWAFPGCLQVQWEHDAEHAAQLRDWREEQPQRDGGPPRAPLLAALHAAREELLTAADLVPGDERTTRLVCGEWTLKDLVGHQADWERVGVMGLRHMAAGRRPDIDPIPDIEAWNRQHAAARRDQDWERCWSDLHATRKELLEVLRSTPQSELQRTHLYPWGPEGTAYEWVRIFATHDREHAEGLRAAAAV